MPILIYLLQECTQNNLMDKTQQNQSSKPQQVENCQKDSKLEDVEIKQSDTVVVEEKLKATDEELSKLRDSEIAEKKETVPTESAKEEQPWINNQQCSYNQFNQFQQWQSNQQPNYGFGPGYGHHGYGHHGYGHHGGYGHHWKGGQDGGHHRGHHGYENKPYPQNQGGYYQNLMQYPQYYQYPPPPPPFMMPPPPPFMMPPGHRPHPAHLPPFVPCPPQIPPPQHGMNYPMPFPPQMQQSSENGVANMPEQGFRPRGHCHRGRYGHGQGHGHGHGKWRKKHSRSRSSSSSPSSSDDQRPANKKPTKDNKPPKPQKQSIRKEYQQQMNGFMQSRMINEMQRQKIIKVLSKKFPDGKAPINEILQYLEIMQKENLVFRMSYVKIIKVLIRFQFDLSQAILKIQKIQRQKIKKFQADKQFREEYGEQQQTPLIEVNDLIILHANDKNIIYLIDGNNILPTNKHLRKYFQSKKKIEKVISQIRCQWYISHCFNKEGQAFLFFDEKFQDSEYQLARKIVFRNEEEKERSKQIPVIFGDGTKADNKIVQKLQELIAKDEKSQIILVTADRDLNMRCQQLKSILHTSGRYFFKYLKYKLNRQYKGDKYMKHMSKEILLYQQCKEQY